MKTKWFETHRLIKGEDLNHHGTLFAGRTAEWLVESGFIAASSLLPPHTLVCMKIHGMEFRTPAHPGSVICFSSKVAYTGRTSVVTYTKIYLRDNPEKILVDGFMTFVHVDEDTKSKAHGISIEIVTDEDQKIYEIAANLKK